MGWIIFEVFFILVVILGSAVFFMIRDLGKRNRMVWALTARVMISAALFVGILFAYRLGLVIPNF